MTEAQFNERVKEQSAMTDPTEFDELEMVFGEFADLAADATVAAKRVEMLDTLKETVQATVDEFVADLDALRSNAAFELADAKGRAGVQFGTLLRLAKERGIESIDMTTDPGPAAV